MFIRGGFSRRSALPNCVQGILRCGFVTSCISMRYFQFNLFNRVARHSAVIVLFLPARRNDERSGMRATKRKMHNVLEVRYDMTNTDSECQRAGKNGNVPN